MTENTPSLPGNLPAITGQDAALASGSSAEPTPEFPMVLSLKDNGKSATMKFQDGYPNAVIKEFYENLRDWRQLHNSADPDERLLAYEGSLTAVMHFIEAIDIQAMGRAVDRVDISSSFRSLLCDLDDVSRGIATPNLAVRQVRRAAKRPLKKDTRSTAEWLALAASAVLLSWTGRLMRPTAGETEFSLVRTLVGHHTRGYRWDLLFPVKADCSKTGNELRDHINKSMAANRDMFRADRAKDLKAMTNNGEAIAHGMYRDRMKYLEWLLSRVPAEDPLAVFKVVVAPDMLEILVRGIADKGQREDADSDPPLLLSHQPPSGSQEEKRLSPR